MTKADKVIGYLEEDGVASTIHFFDAGRCTYHDSDFGDYTRRIRFVYTEKLGKELGCTRWYTLDNAPIWMKELYRRAITE